MEKAIYCLTIEDQPIYIGITACIFKRMKEHRCTYGKNVGVFILDFVSNDYLFWEGFYIAVFKSYGFTLLNISENKNAKLRPTKSKINYKTLTASEKKKLRGIYAEIKMNKKPGC